MTSFLYLLTAFAAGAAGLGLEVLAGRTLAPQLGTGSCAWSALLAVALGSLAAGNLAGGWLAGRPRPERWLGGLLAGAALALGLLAPLHRPAVRWAAGLPPVAGALAAAALTQAVPMLLLGAVSPLLIKAGSGPGIGRWSGVVLAAGSAGGIAGALLTGLWLLPAAGITGSFFCIAALLALAAAAWAGSRWRGGVLLAVGLSSIGAAGWSARCASGEIQSPYGQIEIRREDATRVLLIDGLPQAGLAEPILPWSGLAQGYLLEAALLAQPAARQALVIGLGGGLAPRLLLAHGIQCECVELDPEVLRVARRDFGLPASLPVTLADGRAFLERDGRPWDLIVLDVCTSERLAAHCFTVEFMELIRRRLAPGGVLAVQFIGDRGAWSASVLRTVRQAFAQAQLLEAGGVFSLPVGPQWILAGRRALAEPPAQMWPGGRAPWRRLEPAPHEGMLLTDDRFPAEPRWNQVALCWRQLYSQ